MADLSITASQVQPGTDADYYRGTAGETITAGQAVYLDDVDNKMKKADANTLVQANVKGIALHAASSGQPLRIQTAGSITVGAAAAPAVGTIYVLSATAGGIAPAAPGVTDLVTGMYTTVIGVGGATNTIKLSLFASSQLVP